MARIPYPDDVAQARSTLERMPSLNLFRMVANAPTALRPFLRYGDSLLTDLELDPGLRELAILMVAARTGCDYKRTQSEPIATAVGAPAEQIMAPDSKSTACRLETEVLGFLEQAATAHAVDARALEAVEEALGPRATVELLLVVGHYLAIAILAQSVELELDGPAGVAALEQAERRRAL